MLSSERLSQILQELYELPHLRRIRIHSRVPVVQPERIDDALLSCLSESKLPLILVIHCNHPQELNQQNRKLFLKFKKLGLTMLNQSVLLKEINDQVEILAELSEKLFDYQVLPYYLHQMDQVAGAAHFTVEDTVAVEILRQLRTTLPGYLIPRLVREEPHAPCKSPLL